MTKKECIESRDICRKRMRRLIIEVCVGVNTDMVSTRQKVNLIRSLAEEISLYKQMIREYEYTERRNKAKTIINKLFEAEH